MTRDLTPPLVKEEDFIEQQGSEYCSSVFVIVQKYDMKNFEEKIKTVTQFAVYPPDPMTGNIKCVPGLSSAIRADRWRDRQYKPQHSRLQPLGRSLHLFLYPSTFVCF
eukprot:SAG22_NODE_1513_length_4254_cov_10.073887_3_plen_108_part_00